MTFNIVLVNPQIPQNTGNIGRLTLATNSKLHLVEPLGFTISDTNLKRAGLDYWQYLDYQRHNNFDAFLENVDISKCVFLSSKVENSYWDFNFEDNMYLVFGSETTGLPEYVRDKYKSQCLTIPQYNENVRCLNLANSVSIVLYEAIRQTQKKF